MFIRFSCRSTAARSLLRAAADLATVFFLAADFFAVERVADFVEVDFLPVADSFCAAAPKLRRDTISEIRKRFRILTLLLV